MEEAADNVFMKSAWVKMNKILKYIDKQQDDDVFDVKEFTAKQFELSENRFARLLAMLKDKQPAVSHQWQHLIGYLCQRRQSVWRVSEDKVKLFLAALDKPEHITTYQGMVLDI